MTITSDAFLDSEPIPQVYARDGDNQHPPLTFSEIHDKAVSLVLIVDDPDAPEGLFTHWILYNMSPATLHIPAGQLLPSGAQGTNSMGATGYTGPCPPTGTHTYRFTLHALDIMLDVPEFPDRDTVNAALQHHVLESTVLTGTYRSSLR